MQLYRASAYNAGGQISSGIHALSGALAYEEGKILSLYGKEYIATATNSDDKDLLQDAKTEISEGHSKTAVAQEVVAAAGALFKAGQYARAAPLFAYAVTLLKQTSNLKALAVQQANEAKCYLKLALQASISLNATKARAYAREAVELYPVAAANAVAAGEYQMAALIGAELAGAKAIDVAIQKGTSPPSAAKEVEKSVSLTPYVLTDTGTDTGTTPPAKKTNNTALYVGAALVAVLLLRGK